MDLMDKIEKIINNTLINQNSTDKTTKQTRMTKIT